MDATSAVRFLSGYSFFLQTRAFFHRQVTTAVLLKWGTDVQ